MKKLFMMATVLGSLTAFAAAPTKSDSEACMNELHQAGCEFHYPRGEELQECVSRFHKSLSQSCQDFFQAKEERAKKIHECIASVDAAAPAHAPAPASSPAPTHVTTAPTPAPAASPTPTHVTTAPTPNPSPSHTPATVKPMTPIQSGALKPAPAPSALPVVSPKPSNSPSPAPLATPASNQQYF